MKSESAQPTNFEEYFALFPESTQKILQQVRETIRAAAPDATEKISYSMPTFFYNGNLVHFAAYQHHIGFYPGANGVSAFRKEIAGYKSAKGSIQFPLDRPIPYNLIREITLFR